MRIKSPKVRFSDVTVDNISSTNPNSPSFNMRLLTQLAVKNTNFGHFKYDNSTLTILYNGVPVGEAVIPRARARARRTRRTTIIVNISSAGLPSGNNLGSDINSGVLALTSQARLRGKVHLMKVIKKRKSAEMSCTIAINLSAGAVQEFNCK
ncbi:hypothetical protein LguiA_015716 [Lonicera macranthoides]